MRNNEIVKEIVAALIVGLAVNLFIVILYLFLKNTGHTDVWDEIVRLFKYI